MIIAPSKYSDDIQVGDLVAVAENNSIQVGFFTGRGIGNSFQYWSVHNLSLWLDNGQKTNIGTSKSKPYKYYHNAASPWRVMKITPHCFNTETMEKYEKSIEALKILKVIV